ncbi:uncharacterized protein LOC110097338 [Dendrobium catenatum]|uniref:Uncharacterized protein n=1 Tax=Dendrobium catenatum TaxID=906689 RepID=A0A2I0X1C2_9ASPA|nr:uncharacterized protein LOC110097338 [Dendrobium catenatum]PKU81714.1 hypothetical protein MA16_Dca023772 [Dendrobium catenatum]
MMAPATNNHHEDEPTQHRLEQDIRKTISHLTRHLTALHSSVDHDVPYNRDGVRIITLTGNNNGATMKIDGAAVGQMVETHGMLLGDEKTMRAYSNSNYQAVNNSVLLGGSYTAEDPGIHINFLDFQKEEEEGGDKKEDQKGIENFHQSNLSAMN